MPMAQGGPMRPSDGTSAAAELPSRGAYRPLSD